MSIHFHPNMSYCAVENTASAVGQVLALIEEAGSVEAWVDSLNEYERNSLGSLVAYCREIADCDELLTAAVDNATA